MSVRRVARFPLMRPALMAGAALAALALAPSAAAQDSQERFVPPIGDWSLQPEGEQQQTPTPAPAPAPTPAQPPVVVPEIPPTAAPAPTPAPAQRQPAAPAPTPTPTSAPPPEPAASPTPEPAETGTTPPPTAQPTPLPTPEATPLPAAPVEQPSGGLPRWLVALLAIGLAGGAGWLLLRRRRASTAEAVEEQAPLEPAVAEAPPAPTPAPAAPAAPVPVRRVAAEAPTVRRPAPVPQPPRPATPAPVAADPSLPKGLITTRIPPIGRTAPPPQAPSRPVVPLPAAPRPPAGAGGLGFVVNIHRITLSLAQLMVEFELVAENITDVGVESLDIATALITAHENQDAQIERFFAERPDAPASAIEVAAHSARPLAGRLAMPIAQANRIETNGRAYCVPIMMIDARFRWADGRDERKSAAFVLGKGAQNAPKLGPVFLDRGPTTLREVGARRHLPLRKAS